MSSQLPTFDPKKELLVKIFDVETEKAEAKVIPKDRLTEIIQPLAEQGKGIAGWKYPVIVHKGREYTVIEVSNTYDDGKASPEPIYHGQVYVDHGYQAFHVYESAFTGKKKGDKAEVDRAILETLKALYAQDAEAFWLEVQIEKHLSEENKKILGRFGTPIFVARTAKQARDGKIEQSHIETKWFNFENGKKVNSYRWKPQ